LRANNIADNVVRSLLGSTCGLRYQPAQIEALYRNLTMTLEDSTTYQLIFSKGEARGEVRGEARGRTAEAQTLILSLGGQRFGAAPQPVEEAVRALTDRERLERIALRVLTATDWADLLATL
jgi:predicted transposase YdaD